MVAKVEPAGGWARRMGERSMASRVRWLAMTGLVLVTVAIALEIFRVGRLISPWPVEAAALVMLALAGLAVGASHTAIVALGTRLEILSRALDASPEAQLIVAAEGRIHYANRAFREAFPGPLGSPLDRLRQALCPEAESEAQFHRLRGRVAAGLPATATFALNMTSPAGTGCVKVRIDPIAGHPEYSYWTIQDVSASSRSAAALRDERNILANLLDNAPIGFYSVDNIGRFRYVNRT